MLNVNGAFPVFVRVTVFGALPVPTSWLPRPTLVPDSIATGATPVPVSGTLCEPGMASSERDRDAVRLPIPVGVKVILMLHDAPVATLVPQLLDCVKSPLFVPVIVIPVPVKINGAVP
jgi:hypothetical protein